MKSQMKSLKIKFNGMIKRCSFPNNFNELNSFLAKLFGFSLEELTKIFISYIDEDGDAILLSDQFDFSQACDYMKSQKLELLKITVEKHRSTSTSNQKSFNPNEDLSVLVTQDIFDNALAQSEILRSDAEKNQEFLNDTQREIYRELVRNIPEKRNLRDILAKYIRIKKVIQMHQEICKRRIKRIVKTELKKAQTEILSKAYAQSEKTVEMIFQSSLIKFGQAQEKKIIQNKAEEHWGENLSSVIITRNNHLEVKGGQEKEARMKLKLRNNGKVTWPKKTVLTCIREQSTIFGPSIQLREVIEPGKETQVEVVLRINDIKEEGQYHSVWQLQDQDDNLKYFGMKENLFIKVTFPNCRKTTHAFGCAYACSK